MKYLPAPLTKQTSSKIFNRWIDAVKRNESCSVVNLSKREQFYRLNQFLDKETAKYPHFQFITLDCISEGIEDADDLDRFFEKKIDNKIGRHVCFIIDADNLLVEKLQLLSYLDSLRHQNPNISFIYFFNRNITYPWHTNKLARFGSLYQNLQFHSFYDKPDQSQFIIYLQKKFNIKLPKNTAEKIVVHCDGCLWFIKEAVRHFTQTKQEKDLFSHPEMITRLKIFYDDFEEKEKNVLEKIIRSDLHFNREEKIILAYFQKINLIKIDGKNYLIKSSLLSDFIKKELAKKVEISVNESGQLLVNDVTLDGFFSRREKNLLRYFIQNPTELLGREKTATIIWGESYKTEYSDWALDQVIRRLRNKLAHLGLSRNLIQTKKNQGFYLNINN